MSKMPLVSIIMSIYSEKEEWLRECIESIVTQTFTEFEFIIINDNPTRIENTRILNEYYGRDKRIVIVTNELNIGLTKSLNIGLKLARGKYIARMDADDISFSNRLETQYNFLENNPNYILCGTLVENFGLKKGIRNYPIKHNDCLNELVIDSCFAHPSVMVKKDVLLTHGIEYDVNFKQSQDYRLWVELIGLGEFCNIPEVLLKYRVNEQQISKINNKNQLDYAKQCRKIAVVKLLGSELDEILSDINFTSKDIKPITFKFTSFKNLTPLLWLSLNKYDFFDFKNFVLSGSFLKCTFLQNCAIVKRFILGPNPLVKFR